MLQTIPLLTTSMRPYPGLSTLILVVFLLGLPVNGQETIASKLCFASDAKLLIIHADDLGVSHSENRASIEAIENGSVNSASVMMPTPWVTEVVNYAKKNANTHDFGLHLVLTSEWKTYKWGPVSSRNQVTSLIDQHGYFNDACTSTVKIEEVELELRAQIDRAYAMGLEPTHLDSHMGCLFQSSELLEIYLKMGQEYKLPVMVTKQLSAELRKKYDVKIVLDNFLTMMPNDYAQGAENYYTKALQNLSPGLTTILIHPAYDDDEMKGVSVDHPEWGHIWRQKDFDFFTSEACKKLLMDENIQLMTWRQLSDVYFKD